jgi:hypothetical protein
MKRFLVILFFILACSSSSASGSSNDHSQTGNNENTTAALTECEQHNAKGVLCHYEESMATECLCQSNKTKKLFWLNFKHKKEVAPW